MNLNYILWNVLFPVIIGSLVYLFLYKINRKNGGKKTLKNLYVFILVYTVCSLLIGVLKG